MTSGGKNWDDLSLELKMKLVKNTDVATAYNLRQSCRANKTIMDHHGYPVELVEISQPDGYLIRAKVVSSGDQFIFELGDPSYEPPYGMTRLVCEPGPLKSMPSFRRFVKIMMIGKIELLLLRKCQVTAKLREVLEEVLKHTKFFVSGIWTVGHERELMMFFLENNKEPLKKIRFGGMVRRECPHSDGLLPCRSCLRENERIDPFIAHPNFIQAAHIQFTKTNELDWTLIQKITKMWIEKDANVGTRMIHLAIRMQSINMFSRGLFPDRFVYSKFNQVRIRTDNKEKHILLFVKQVMGRGDILIFCVIPADRPLEDSFDDNPLWNPQNF
ncbi:unnamed protein product [Caenorhabditis sp. 36 PRJEB53466]|nr:unnamed protein product [Caenorhabditis sp. 36 PRJEB53466]